MSRRLVNVAVIAVLCCGCNQLPKDSWKQRYDLNPEPITDMEIHEAYGGMDLTPVEADRPNVFTEITIYYPSGKPLFSVSRSE